MLPAQVLKTFEDIERLTAGNTKWVQLGHPLADRQLIRAVESSMSLHHIPHETKSRPQSGIQSMHLRLDIWMRGKLCHD